MRVLHLTRDFPPRINGGLSTAVGGLVRAARAAGIDGAVISFDAWRPRGGGAPGPPPAPVDGVLRIGSPAQLEAAASFARAFAPDVVHVHHALLFDALPRLAPRVLSVHVAQRELRRLRGLDAPTASERAQDRALEEADRVLVPSEAARGAVGRGEVVPLGVDLPETVPPPAAAPTALYVGRFADVKGTAELLAAVGPLRARLPEARLRLAGGLPDNPRSERRWRRRMAEAGAAVEVLGWLDGPALERAYAEAAVVVAPSWTETYGGAVVEAMARGRPVVASRAGALAERLTDGAEGRLVPPREPEALGAAIAELLADPERRGAMGKAARARALSEAWPLRVGGFVRVYRALAGRPVGAS